MSTGKDTLERWFDTGVSNGDDFMIVVCDTFDWEDYPVYCSEKEFASEYKSVNGTNMQKVMEVYDLKKDKHLQLAQGRTFNYPSSFTPQ